MYSTPPLPLAVEIGTFAYRRLSRSGTPNTTACGGAAIHHTSTYYSKKFGDGATPRGVETNKANLDLGQGWSAPVLGGHSQDFSSTSPKERLRLAFCAVLKLRHQALRFALDGGDVEGPESIT